MTRGKNKSSQNRFSVQAPGAGQNGPGRPDIASLRTLERSESRHLRGGDVYLPNPRAEAPIDRNQGETYDQKSYALGLAPNANKHFWQLIKGDAGSGPSSYRVAELFQELGATGSRTAGTPYSKAIQLATMSSSDQRPRYFHASLFSVGRIILNSDPGGTGPLSYNEVTEFAAGIPDGTTSITGNTQFGVPQFSTVQFRVMVADESGQRFVDVDVLGTRSINLYGIGVTVFALIKENGYEIDRQRDDNPQLGPGILDQAVVGARIIPIIRNDTKNTNNRTVSIISPPGPSEPTVIPIPPGARRVQGYTTLAGANSVSVFFATVDPLNPAVPTDGNQGIINFPPAPRSRTEIYNIPNSNSIVITNDDGNPGRLWIFVFEVTS